MSALDLSSPPSPLFLSSLMPSFFFIFAPHTTFVFPPSTRLFPTYFSRRKKWERRVKRTIFFRQHVAAKKVEHGKPRKPFTQFENNCKRYKLYAFCPTCFNLCDAQLLRRKTRKTFSDPFVLRSFILPEKTHADTLAEETFFWCNSVFCRRANTRFPLSPGKIILANNNPPSPLFSCV